MWEFEELVIAAVTMSRAAQQNQNPLLELIHLKENFQWFCQEGDFNAVEIALKRGVDVNNVHGETNQTGLMAALRQSENNIVRLLLQQEGVNILWKNSQGASAFTAATEGQNITTFRCETFLCFRRKS